MDRPLLSVVLADPGPLVDECLARGIWWPRGRASGSRHELVRMAVEAGIGPLRKAEPHSRLLAVLDARGTPTRPSWPTTPRDEG